MKRSQQQGIALKYWLTKWQLKYKEFSVKKIHPRPLGRLPVKGLGSILGAFSSQINVSLRGTQQCQKKTYRTWHKCEWKTLVYRDEMPQRKMSDRTDTAVIYLSCRLLYWLIFFLSTFIVDMPEMECGFRYQRSKSGTETLTSRFLF